MITEQAAHIDELVRVAVGETSARDTLDKQCSDYPDADRARCVRASSLGGPASYVDLLTCLDMAKSVRALPKDRQDPLGVPPASR